MMSRSRQLAAIMFTDIQGYTALMQQNEQKAVLARDKHRRIFNSVTEKYGGRVLQYYGDGTLSIFDSALAAVKCGIEMQLTEIRVADLRFTLSETADFLNLIMGLDLSPEDITALESRTEGWIAGLQMAALSMQGRVDAAGFIEAFTGSHRFILDYLARRQWRYASDRPSFRPGRPVRLAQKSTRPGHAPTVRHLHPL